MQALFFQFGGNLWVFFRQILRFCRIIQNIIERLSIFRDIVFPLAIANCGTRLTIPEKSFLFSVTSAKMKMMFGCLSFACFCFAVEFVVCANSITQNPMSKNSFKCIDLILRRIVNRNCFNSAPN